jgi:DNA-binding winged helix-turn-helix (wHTH) protein
VDVAIFGLRRKLGSFGRYVETVRGVGYRLAESGKPTAPPRVEQGRSPSNM